MTRNHVVGPVFVDGSITGERYRELLLNEFIPRLKELGYDINNIVFQQDNAPGHTASLTIDLLREFFGDRVISRSAHFPVETHWPARSCDLSSCDFALWPYVKQRVRAMHPQTIEMLKNDLITVFGEITQDFCQKVFASFVRRLHKCVESNGCHVEKNEVVNF